MSARNFYIMQSAVEPMVSELPCYTPLTNHATHVHTVPMVFASDYDTLRTANQRLEGESKRMREALIEVTASLEWNAHGICRGINDGPIMPSAMAVDFAKAALADTGEQQ